MDVNNQGLNLPSNLQNLDVRSELLSTEVGSGASCAYSLRDLTGNNLNCVRVRRTPYDENDTINDETTFACQAVQAGKVEDWVNGKLEDQLPADEVAVEVSGGSEVAGKYYSRIKYSSNPETLDPVFVYYNDDLTVPLKLLRFSSGTSQRWRFERQDNNDAVIDPTNRGTVYNSPVDVPNSDWVGTGNLAITSITKVSQADSAYSLRKVNSSYGIPNTVVNGTENFPATVPSSGSPADIGNGFTAHKFSDGVADSESVTVSGGTITVTAIASGTGSFSAGCRLKGLADGKQYTVSGEFRVTSKGADGGGVALVDISDDTAGTDEDSITTSSTTFTPFFIDAGYNGGSNDNFVDLQANSSGSNSGTLTAEFRNVQIIENNNSAVRIRRSSDDEEVVVGFDSDNKVSASSPVTATPSGSTTATDLNGFLNESTENFSAIAYADINSDFQQFTSTPTISDTAISGATGSVDTLSARLGFKLPSQLTISDYSGLKIKVTGTVNSFTGDESLVISPSKVANGGTTFTPTEGGKVITSGTTGNFEFIFTGDTTNTFQSVVFKFGDNSSFDISNLKFEIIEHGATVHTWYDQAGSNNAVQETAGNQPKIAENGALITENNNTAIDFEESSSQFLLISKAFANSSGADVSIFSVSKNVATDGSNAHPIISNRSGSTNGYQFGYDGTDHLEFVHFANTANNAVSTETYETQILGSAIRDNLTFDIFGNSDKRADNTASSYVASTDFTRIGGNENASKFMDGTMQEIVIFESDQSNNRFKIESNINNYYGLYNDANEFSGNPTAEVTPSAITLTNVSKTGFTAEISGVSGTKQINFPLLNSLLSGDDYFVSFDYTSTSTSTVGVKPRTAVLGGASNDVISATNSGFYGGTGDSQHNGFDINNTATVLSFQTTAQGFTFTVSNLRVSRIARNGFVETLYDQSGNGRDMAQTTAGDQPHIVENGGICKDSTNNPTVKYVNVGTNLGSTFLSTTAGAISSGETSLCYLTVASISTNVPTRQTFNGAGTDFCLGGTNLRLRYNGSANTFTTSSLAMSVNTNHLVVASVNSSKICTLHLDDNSETDTSAFTANASTLNQFLGENSSSSTGDNLGLQGTMSEMILYLGDKTNDISDLQNDINNFYNI